MIEPQPPANAVLYRCGRFALFAASLTVLLPFAHAQSIPTATRAGDLQIGGGFVFANSNYNFNPTTFYGGLGYVDFAKRYHWGGEFEFRHSKASTDSTVTETTYELGPRVFVHRGAVVPYAKAMFGRGVYNFSNNVANIAYNMYVFGGGLDIAVRRSINVRADYEYQTWMGFPISNLHPSVTSIGVAYHFHE